MKLLKKINEYKNVNEAIKKAKMQESAFMKALYVLEGQMITIQDNQVEFERYLKEILEQVKR